METPQAAPPLAIRIVEGLERVGTVLKSDAWGRARAAGINPTQLAILKALGGRDGLSVKELALQLGVSQPTATDSILAIERKALVEKRPDPADARAVRIAITEAGRALIGSGEEGGGAVGRGVAALAHPAQEELLALLVAVIRQLQEQDAIPVQRMCVSCRHFRPHAHADAARPHHCTFVDAAFGPKDLRIDCREHEIADPSAWAATWARLQKDHPLPPPDI